MRKIHPKELIPIDNQLNLIGTLPCKFAYMDYCVLYMIGWLPCKFDYMN